MSHSSKQFMAWTIAFGLSTAIYGGGAYWLKKSGAVSAAHDDDHDGVAAHGEKHHGDDHGDAHAAAGTHGDNHGQEPAEEHGDAHGDKHAAATTHGNEHGDAHGDKHAAAPTHGNEHSDKHAAAPTHGNEHATSSHDNAKHDNHATPDKAAAHKDHAPHWTYGKNDAGGPSHWGDLAKNFVMCEKGMEQSPIDLKNAVAAKDAPKISFFYGKAKLSVENNGHTIQSNLSGGDNHITIDGERYSLAQFHFHNPSEHRIAGIASDLELHFVHKNAAGGLAVIGVMINERSGKENKFFKPVWDIMPRDFNSKAKSPAELSLTSLLPTSRQYFHYKGSLTTPPCSEGVRWFVMKDPTTMSGGQVEMYSSIFGAPTNRPVQPLQGRDIITNGAPSLAH